MYCGLKLGVDDVLCAERIQWWCRDGVEYCTTKNELSLNQPFDIGKWYEEEEEVCVRNVDVIRGNLQTSFDLNRHIDHK